MIKTAITRRFAAAFLSLCMVLSLIPMASAADISISDEMMGSIYDIIENRYPDIYEMMLYDPLTAPNYGEGIYGNYYFGDSGSMVSIGDSKANGYASQTASALGASVYNINVQLADAMLEGLTSNSTWQSKVKAADIVTVNVNNTFSFDCIRQFMSGIAVDLDWEELVGAENTASIDEALAMVNDYFSQMGLGVILGLDVAELMTVLIECYVYDYVNTVIYIDDIVKTIHELNPRAEVVLIGLVNSFDGITMVQDGQSIDLGGMFSMIVDAGSRFMTTVAVMNEKTTFINARDAETGLSSYSTVTMNDMTGLIMGILLNNTQLPNSNGNTYIKNQIASHESRVNSVLWQEGSLLKAESQTGGTLVMAIHDADGRMTGMTMQAIAAGTHEVDLSSQLTGGYIRAMLMDNAFVPLSEYVTIYAE